MMMTGACLRRNVLVAAAHCAQARAQQRKGKSASRHVTVSSSLCGNIGRAQESWQARNLWPPARCSRHLASAEPVILSLRV